MRRVPASVMTLKSIARPVSYTHLSGVALDQLPDVCPTGTVVGFLRPEIAQALSLPENVRVVIGSHDQIVNALACGVCEHGDGVDVSGTCECIEPLFAGIPLSLIHI